MIDIVGSPTAVLTPCFSVLYWREHEPPPAPPRSELSLYLLVGLGTPKIVGLSLLERECVHTHRQADVDETKVCHYECVELRRHRNLLMVVPLLRCTYSFSRSLFGTLIHTRARSVESANLLSRRHSCCGAVPLPTSISKRARRSSAAFFLISCDSE
jgi:hypothetical protein